VRGQRRPGPAGAVDLAALARSLAPLVRETVSRSIDLDWQLPDGAALAAGPREDLELLVLLAVQELVRHAPGGARLGIGVERSGAGGAVIAFALDAAAARSVPSTHPWDSVLAGAARSLAAQCGARWERDEDPPRVTLRFPLPDDLTGE
jgi:hypothetical protein